MAATDVSRSLALRRAAIRATHAYSVHNTQPWRFVLHPGRLDVLADASRRLEALDPAGRQLTISLGAAVLDIRAALASAGLHALVELLPEPVHPDLVACVRIDGDDGDGDDHEEGDVLGQLDALIETRQSGVDAFTGGDLPAGVIDAIEKSATEEGALVQVICDHDLAVRMHALGRQARDIELVDLASRAELHAWTGSTEPEPGHQDAGTVPCVVVLGGVRDDRAHWLRTGAALERALLEITRYGYAASPNSALVEVPATRAELRDELGLDWHPHAVLRVGTASPRPEPRRRRLVDVLFEAL